MRKAIEESKALEDQSKSKAQAEEDEEAEMIRQALAWWTKPWVLRPSLDPLVTASR